MNKAKALLISSRPWSFPMTLGSVLVGSLLAARTGGFHTLRLVLVAIGTVMLHGAVNLTNDYYDFREEVDREGSPTTRYRQQPLVEEWFEPNEIRAYFSGMYLVGIVIGLYLTYVSGPLVLAIGILGVVLGYSYTGGVKYKYWGWGEVAVFLVWGPLLVTGAYYVQSGSIGVLPFLVSIPLGLLVALTLLANNLRDRVYDQKAGVNTIANLLDKRDAVVLYLLITVGTYSVLGYLILEEVLSPWGALVFLSFPLAYKLLKTFVEEIPDDADARTARLDVAFSGLLTVSILLEVVL
ncbi:MAG: 1,4-dihydroxy-2-naphthoate octaprenyltransferase [Candidatus Acetothermia bacterium]